MESVKHPVTGRSSAPSLVIALLVACSSTPLVEPNSAPTGTAEPTTSPETAHADPDHHEHSFADVEQYARRFDSPDRVGWQKPAEVVELLDLFEGAAVVDLGAGTGYFLPYLSAAVGSTGVVLALDAESNLVAYMRRRIRLEELSNTRAEQVPKDDPQLLADQVDRILVVNTWHHLPHRSHYAAKLCDALRRDGELLIVDFSEDAPMGPPRQFRLSPEQVVAEVQRNEHCTAEVISEELPHQYAVRARPLRVFAY